MDSLRRIVRSGLRAFVISTALVVLTVGAGISAKAQEVAGPHPHLVEAAGPPYIPAIDFEIGAIIKFRPKK
jgi:hypothetical protein